MGKYHNIILGLSILTSLMFILTFKYSSLVAFGFIVITILLDLSASLINKSYYNSDEYRIVGAASARLSEGIMFSLFFIPWFYLFALNNILTIINFKRHRYTALPLRLIFSVFFLFEFII